MNMNNLKWIVCCIFIVLSGVSVAQTPQDTTLRLMLSPDKNQSAAKLKPGKLVKSYVWEDDACIITCKNDPSTIKKVLNQFSTLAIAITIEPEEQPDITTSVSEQVPIPIEVVSPPIKKPIVKFDPAIDIFLNIEDETIFSDEKFIELDSEKIHPRSRNYYCLISNIRQFSKKMEEVLNLKFGQDEQAKRILAEADILYQKIVNDNNVIYLTQKQKDYFNKDLLPKYNSYNHISR